MSNNELLGALADAKHMCEAMDIMIERFVSAKEQINIQREAYKKIEKRYSYEWFLPWYAAALAALLIPLGILQSFISFRLLPLYPFVAAALAGGWIIYRKNTYLKVHKNAYESTVSAQQHEIDAAIEFMVANKTEYEAKVSILPEQIRHIMAIDFIYEAVKQGYSHSLDDAVEFYCDQLERIKGSNLKEARLLCRDVLLIEDAMKEKIKVLNEATGFSD